MERIDMCLRLTFSVRRKLLSKSTYRLLHTSNLVSNEFENDLKKKIDQYKDKILYNTVIHGENQSFITEMRKRKRILLEQKALEADSSPVSIYASCIKEIKNPSNTLDTVKEIKNYDNDKIFNMPFNKPNLSVKNNLTTISNENNDDIKPDIKHNWMTDYEFFDDSKLKDNNGNCVDSQLTRTLDEEDLIDDEIWNDSLDPKRSLTDPQSKVSTIPCGGCGALFHCKDVSIPGFVPKDIFKNRNNNELKSLTCQRCHFLKEYNIALNVNVSPEEYVELLMKIKSERALVIIMIDILDFPCSIWPGIMDIIGTKRPIFVVGNKVDMLPQDSRGYLQHILHTLENSLKDSALKDARIKHIALISAKTGYGVEELINKLHQIWEYNGDVYLVGCTNVGKSTLFNALIQSDYCKVQASDLLQRATVSQWPGTTLNLLKFPILRPSNWRLTQRSMRLRHELDSVQAETKLRNLQLKSTNDPKHGTLIGHIGQTFVNLNNFEDMTKADPFSYQMRSGFRRSGPVFGINENHKNYVNSKWFYDTPGVVHPDQILSILTVDELMLTIPKELIRPRSFYMREGMTLFLGGLSRVDILECEQEVLLTVFASRKLPLTVCNSDDAEVIYSSFLGTDLLAVPTGGEERLDKWPLLECKELSVIGEGWKSSGADIVLSSSGWVSITGKSECLHKILAWTPEGRGIHLRTPSLLQNAIQLKGKRMRGTPAYNLGKPYIPVYK